MRRRCLSLLSMLVALAVADVHAYGHYEPRRILTVSHAPSGEFHGVDVVYLDRILDDLASRARHYPTRFDSLDDKNRATRDVIVLSRMLDVLVSASPPDPELLLRCALLHSFGHNLDIPGAADRARAIFPGLLDAAPDHPQGNYFYGAFLASSGHPRAALAYLQRARELGVTDAIYTLGIAYMALGRRNEALRHLVAYRRDHPDVEPVQTLIEAIRDGAVDPLKPDR